LPLKNIISESQPQGQLNTSWIVHGRDLPETGQWISRVITGAEGTVQREVVSVIECVERLAHYFQPQAFSEQDGPAETCTNAEEVISNSGIAADERSVHYWARCGALNGIDAGGNVQGQGRVILQHAAQLKAVTNEFPGGFRRSYRGMDGTVEDHAMTLVVIRPSIIPPDVEVVDGGAKEKVTYVIQSFLPSVGDAIISPPDWPLHK